MIAPDYEDTVVRRTSPYISILFSLQFKENVSSVGRHRVQKVKEMLRRRSLQGIM